MVSLQNKLLKCKNMENVVKNPVADRRKITGGMLYMVLIILLLPFGCEKLNKVDSALDKEAFCLQVNEANIDQTIPIINEFLENLSNDLNDEQKLQALETWLNSCPCITDATIVCVSCIKTLPLQSEIAISFEENGITKNFILDISMSNPLKAMQYHGGMAPKNKVLMLTVDYTTNTFMGGKELVFFSNSDSFTITNGINRRVILVI